LTSAGRADYKVSVDDGRLSQAIEGSTPLGNRCARVAELADARDLGSRGKPWGFKSPLSHHPVTLDDNPTPIIRLTQEAEPLRFTDET
jgi:hypothetical protein